MNFFLHIHRSIFDPMYCRAVAGESRRVIFGYLLLLLLLAGVVSGGMRVFYLLDAQRGIVTPLAEAFSGMEINDGTLYPNRSVPYEPSPSAVSAIFGRLFDMPPRTAEQASLMVDTAEGRTAPEGFPVIVLRSTDVLLVLASDIAYAFPYHEVLLGERNLQFTETGVRSFLMSHLITMLFYFSAIELLRCVGAVAFGICILAFAAYIFRFERQRRLGWFFRVASCAIVPIPITVILIALADVRIPGAWNIAVIFSFVIMFRALAAAIPRGKAGSGA